MQWQLRLYRAKDGELEDFAREWHEHVLPLRRAQGFEVLGPWIAEDGRFVWIVGHDDLRAADAAYYAARNIVPDPARHLAETEHVFMEER